TQVDKNLNVTRYYYDADNRPTETDEEGTSGHVLTSTLEEYHDAQNQVIDVGPRSVNGERIRTIHQNDSLGRNLSLSVQNGSLASPYGTSVVTLVQNQYDGDGNVTATFDAAGNQATYAYDGANRKLSMTEGANDPNVAGTTHFTYDRVG